MKRYLMHVSYIGTQFRGVQKIINRNEPFKPDATTIQGSLEIALHKLRSVNVPLVIPSSRTDTGVHALCSTFHVDLLRRSGEPYNPSVITTILNKYFMSENKFIRIIKTAQVPDDFHCRFHAKSRTYLYRLAVLKNEYLDTLNKHSYHIPIEEYQRCCFISEPNFNIENMQNAAKLFLGLHDFRTFMGKGSHQMDKITRRNLDIKITEGCSSACLEMNKNIYNYYNITCKSSGFLYNQVRRIVGTLIAAGQGKVTSKEIQCMLQIPSHLAWNPRIKIAPSYALYLCRVEYSPDCIEASFI